MRKAAQYLAIALCVSGLLAPSAHPENVVLSQKSVKVLPTKDVVVIAWINGDIPYPSILDGVDPVLIAKLATPVACSFLLADWAIGLRTNISTDADRRYANAFLIGHSANVAPSTPSIDPDVVQAVGDYRAFARFKVAYRVKDGKVIGEPVYLQSVASVGATPDPCGILDPVAAQAHPLYNGDKGITVSQTGVYLLTEGRVGFAGQLVDTTLNDYGGFITATTPWIWAAIKFDTAGNLVFPFAIGTRANFQIFPTYFVYQDGQFQRQIQQGALEPFISLNNDSVIIPPLP